MDLVQNCCQYIIVNEETRVSWVYFILCQERNHGAKTRLCKHPWGIGRDTKVSCTAAVSEGECGRWGMEREGERERERHSKTSLNLQFLAKKLIHHPLTCLA